MIVLLTGGSGFIGAEIATQLADRGYSVRGTLRSLKRKPEIDSRIDWVEADLLDAASLAAAARGADLIVHAASPYVLDAKDPQRDLVDPAVKGTVNMLEAARQAGTVKRMVVTSSMAAITDEPENDRVLTEADWNVKSSLERNPYYYSKTVAERAAWDFVRDQKPAFDVVTINPFLVIGPSRVASLNTSNQLFADLLNGVYPGIMSLTFGMVDVRDVAAAHIAALETPAASGRHICAGETIDMRAVVGLLTEHGYGEGRKLPKLGLDCAIGDFAVRLSSYSQPKGVGTYLRTHVGRVPRYDTSKIQKELGIRFRPVRESILDTLTDMKRWGHLDGQRDGQGASA